MSSFIVNQQDLSPTQALVFLLLFDSFHDLTNYSFEDAIAKITLANKVAYENDLGFPFLFNLSLTKYYEEFLNVRN